jgi:hypothetical protein
LRINRIEAAEIFDVGVMARGAPLGVREFSVDSKSHGQAGPCSMDSLREAVLLGSLRDGLQTGDAQASQNPPALAISKAAGHRSCQFFLINAK